VRGRSIYMIDYWLQERTLSCHEGRENARARVQRLPCPAAREARIVVVVAAAAAVVVTAPSVRGTLALGGRGDGKCSSSSSSGSRQHVRCPGQCRGAGVDRHVEARLGVASVTGGRPRQDHIRPTDQGILRSTVLCASSEWAARNRRAASVSDTAPALGCVAPAGARR
jgi:hypothetical protein